MTRIGLISDTHGFLDPLVFRHFENVDQIWHAGDFGNPEVYHQLKTFKPLHAVWGNIDGSELRSLMPEFITFSVEDVKIFMIHIGGYPSKYNPKAKKKLLELKPQIFICGHSHILKIMYDKHLRCLHLNPGAAGNEGWHKIRTLIRFEIEGKQIQNCEIIELGKRGLKTSS